MRWPRRSRPTAPSHPGPRCGLTRPTATHRTPLYAPPAGLRNGQTWYTRQEIDTLPAAQAALQGRAVAWLADP
ncbi:MAG: hypothetical protein B7Y02_10170, partial [Rhodobacterales bacterium 17-64-5]